MNNYIHIDETTFIDARVFHYCVMNSCYKNKYIIQPCAVTLSDTEFLIAAKLLKQPAIIWCTGRPGVGKSVWALKVASILLQYFEPYVSPLYLSFSNPQKAYECWKKLIKYPATLSDKSIITESRKGIFPMDLFMTMPRLSKHCGYIHTTGYDFLTDKIYRMYDDCKTNLVIVDGIENYIDPGNEYLQQRFISSISDFLSSYPAVTIFITAAYPSFLPAQMPAQVSLWNLEKPDYLNKEIQSFSDIYLRCLNMNP